MSRERFLSSFQELINSQGEAAFIFTINEVQKVPLEILAYINISNISTMSPQLPDLTDTLEDLCTYLYWDAALTHNEVNIIDQQLTNYTTQRRVPLPLQLSTHSFSTKSNQPLQMFNGASSMSTNPTTVTSKATATDFSVDSAIPQVAVFGK